MDKNEEYQAVILGALLHDIGKFWQRSGKNYNKKYQQLAKEDYGENGAHAKWSASLIIDHNLLSSNFANSIEPLVLFHHKPTSAIGKIIKRADKLSAGEREERDVIEFFEDKKKDIELNNEKIKMELIEFLKTEIIEKPFFKRLPPDLQRPYNEVYQEIKNSKLIKIEMINRWQQKLCGDPRHEALKSVFGRINIEIDNSPAIKGEEWYYELNILDLEKTNIFPTQKYPSLYYKQLCDNFVKEAEKSHNDFTILYYLLQKYCWSVPSAAYLDVPDVSLFDHLKTTCAIASCLYKSDSEEKFILIGGDISGIQNFIYTITSKGAIKGLRGRSLYLQLLTEVLAKYIINKLGLPITNILYCGGGHFFILAPINAKINNLKKEITEKLLEYHKGDLYLALGYVDISAKDFADFGKKFDECSEQLVIIKKKKFSEVLEKEYNNIFKLESGELCDVCKNEVKPSDLKVEDDVKKCKLCKSFEDLANDLKDAKYLIENQDKSDHIQIKSEYENVFKDFGFKLKFINNLENLQESLQGEKIVVYTLNNTDFLNENLINSVKNKEISLGFKFLADTTPIWIKEDLDKEKLKKYFDEHGCNLGDIKSIDVIELESTGIKRIGILRADVDNLGKIFAKGLENRSISRISTLSSMLIIFFNGYLNNIVEDFIKKKNRENQIYIIYSGGDDLFIVGAWDLIIDLAKEIYDSFREFTCSNPNITFSCGISIVDAKFPMYKGAEMTKTSLDNAKVKGKNRIDIFNSSFEWNIKIDNEFESLVELKKKIIEALKKDVSRALLYRIFETYSDFENFKKEFEEGKYALHRKWMLNYYLKKFAGRYKNAELELKKIEELYDKIIWNNIDWNNKKIRGNYMIIPTAVKWAELLTRGE